MISIKLKVRIVSTVPISLNMDTSKQKLFLKNLNKYGESRYEILPYNNF